jgi:RNA exonuclease 1
LYSCCNQDAKSDGCQISKHVYDGDDYDSDEPLQGFVQTKPPVNLNVSMSKSNIFAIDCEMVSFYYFARNKQSAWTLFNFKCYTTKGLELTRVSIIDLNLNLVYDTVVQPDFDIIDYNTRWSGLTEYDFRSCTTKLIDVQEYLLNLFNSNTILIGHSLESDLKALKVLKVHLIDSNNH